MTLIAALLLTLSFASQASAADPDPDAPAGASPSWLPNADWVNEHWLPYDETRLERRLGMSYKDVRKWMTNNPQPLAVLIRQKGMVPRRLASELVAPWRGAVSPSMHRRLWSRTMKTFTQQHLADHMFGHLFHQGSWQREADRIFGIPKAEVNRRHAAGESLAQIGARSGRSLRELVAAMSRYLRAAASRGERSRQTPAAQARRWYARQLEQLPEWLSRARTPGHSPSRHPHHGGGAHVARGTTGAASPSSATAARSLPGFAELCRLP